MVIAEKRIEKKDRKKLRRKYGLTWIYSDEFLNSGRICRNTSLLSFGDEADEDESDLRAVIAKDGLKIMSSHDLLDDQVLLKDSAEEVVSSRLRSENEAEEREQLRLDETKQKLKEVAKTLQEQDKAQTKPSDEKAVTVSFDDSMRQNIKKKQQALANVTQDEEEKYD